jgi:thioredoxin reductase
VTLYAPPQDELTTRRLANLGIPHVTDPITRVVGVRDHLEAIEVAGERVEVDRIFVAAQPRPRDELLRQLGAAFEPTPFGTAVVVSRTGATSVPGVWAVGNVSTLSALVPIAMGEGVAAATELNAGLTMEAADAPG